MYERLYEALSAVLPPPDVLIAPSCSLSTTKKRIARRGRAMEAAIPDAYLRRLHRLYEEWFASYTLSPIVRIDTTDLDYVENLVDLIELRRRLDEALADAPGAPMPAAPALAEVPAPRPASVARRRKLPRS